MKNKEINPAKGFDNWGQFVSAKWAHKIGAFLVFQKHIHEQVQSTKIWQEKKIITQGKSETLYRFPLEELVKFLKIDFL